MKASVLLHLLKNTIDQNHISAEPSANPNPKHNDILGQMKRKTSFFFLANVQIPKASVSSAQYLGNQTKRTNAVLGI